jgi:hypothetical protein
MEIVAHALWATAAGKVANRRMAKVGIVSFAAWALIPDLFAFAPEVIVGLWRRFTGSATGLVVPSGNCSDGRKIWIAHERAGSTQRATNHS